MKKAFLILAVVLIPSAASPQFAYEHKYGPNQYNYDVSGYGDSGYVSGNMDTDGRYVEGTITLENGDEVEVSGEWVDRGRMSVEDADGNAYDLQVD